MSKSCNKDFIINIGFYGGLILKGANALAELIGGFIMLVVSHEWLNKLVLQIALPELRQDPDDPLMNYLITRGLNISSQHSVAVFMLFHGLAKMIIIWLLWKNKMWAYPLAFVAFGIFISYEAHSFWENQSLFMLLIVVFDLAIITMIALKYRSLKREKTKQYELS
ncbi:MAG: putative rane protein [Firmicutes bacterium]|nr:putative rane protein [Bacillota bacterium]